MVSNRRGRPPINGCELLASRLGVGAVTVGRWLGGDMQCSNAEAIDLVELAIDLIPDRAEEILNENSARYHEKIIGLFIDHGGDVLSPH